MAMADHTIKRTTEETVNQTEQWLDSIGVKYQKLNLRLASIDVEKSLRNQARVGEPVNKDVVAVYAEAYRKGDVFPPIIVFDDGHKLVTVADGNHRTQAALSVGLEQHPAYLVEQPTPAQQARMLYEANLRHGLPSSLPDRLHHAPPRPPPDDVVRAVAGRSRSPSRRGVIDTRQLHPTQRDARATDEDGSPGPAGREPGRCSEPSQA
jgi:disulfide oxidoreductase YuzD